MKLKVKKCLDIEGIVKAPPSKSYTHRAVIIASLANGTSHLYSPLISEDTIASIGACRILGADINQFSNYLEIVGTGGNIEPSFQSHIFGIEPEKVINLYNSGTSLRLLTSIAALSKTQVNFDGDDSLRTRPMNDLLNALKPLGVKTESNNGKAPLTVYPGYIGGKTSISGSISSQFISSILISGALSSEGVELEVLPEFVSKPYVDMTISVMEQFGVNVDRNTMVKHEGCEKEVQACSIDSFKVSPQEYHGTDYIIEGDYSSASYLLGATAIFGGKLTILNLFKDSKQGDKLIIDILRDMGASILVEDDYVTIESDGNLKGINVDLTNAPDLLITVAVLGAFGKGETKITGVGHSRFKETDRIATTCEELIKCGCNVRELDDGMIIEGGSIKEDGEIIIDSHLDHRLAMAFSLIGLKHNITIEHGEVFDVSFPQFIEPMGEIGVNLDLSY